MWKSLFYYTKSERRAIYVLLVLLFVLIVALVVVPGERPLPAPVSSVPDSVECRSAEPAVSSVLTAFDPNLADSAELTALGLPAHVVRNVLKYRQKGGSFPTPESFARIYGLTEAQYEELKPYIRISESFARKPFRKKSAPVARDTLRRDTLRWPKAEKYPEGTLVDANTADTTELKKIPGIGSGIARAIVGYRHRLGGFCSLEQLQEIKYITPELLRWFKLENDSVRRLDINRAGLDQLRAHPYLNFYQAKVIVEHRRKRGNITSLSQLSLYEEFTEKDLQRIAAYLRFD
jgi:competence ComEA-like helix-hairpin-helix protein